jgi:hypothetical protein
VHESWFNRPSFSFLPPPFKHNLLLPQSSPPPVIFCAMLPMFMSSSQWNWAAAMTTQQ